MKKEHISDALNMLNDDIIEEPSLKLLEDSF